MAAAKHSSRLLHGAAIGMAAACMALALWSAGLLTSWEAATYDVRVRILARPGPATDEIRIILLDQHSLDWGKEQFGLGWPWPRQVYAPVVDFCRRAKATALAFDVVYTEPSVYGVADDKALGDAMQAYGHTVMPIDLHLTDGSDEHWPPAAPVPTHDAKGFTAWAKGRGLTANLATFPIPEIARHATLLGNVNNEPDDDTVYRRLGPMLIFDERHVPSLPLALFLAARPQAQLAMDAGGMNLFAPQLKRHIPLDRHGKAILRYRGALKLYKPVSAAAVIQSELQMAEGKKPLLDPADFTGKFVFFGFSATGLLDLRPTPLGGVTPGVVVNATFLDNLISGDFIKPLPRWISALVILFMGVVTGLQHVVAARVRAMLTVSALTFALPIAAAFWLYGAGWWMPLVAPLVASAAALAGTGMYKYATEGRQRRFIKSAFKQYLSPQVIDQLLENPDRLRLGGERREISIFFSDIQGFTTISESLDPVDLTAVLNDFLTAMTDIIQGEGGTVDKYEGDAIIAFWNAPVSQPDHALRAVRAAMACQEKLAEMRGHFRKRTGHAFHMRIGINTGPAVVGNLGSHSRFDYTMLGDAVNLAARLEGANKQFGTYTMISRATLEAMTAQAQTVGAFPCRELARLQVVGKNEAVTVFEPMPPAEAAARRNANQAFASALEAFYAGAFSRAAEAFAPLTEVDPAAARYLTRCRELASTPPQEWNGVWTLTSK